MIINVKASNDGIVCANNIELVAAQPRWLRDNRDIKVLSE